MVGWNVRRCGASLARPDDAAVTGYGVPGYRSDEHYRSGMSFFTPAGDLPAEAGWTAASAWTGEAATTGPWSAEAMHGGPPSALLVRACEQVCPASLTALRASLDFLSPVPVGPVEVRARTVRTGRRITLAEAVLSARGRDALRATVWFLDAASGGPSLAAHSPSAPVPAACPPGLVTWTFPYAQALEARVVAGAVEGQGDAACWLRPRIPLVAGEEPSGLQRAVLVADSASGISARLDWDAWSYVNVDLAVHLSRPLRGEWVLLDATTRYEASGTGLATAALRDGDGPVGRVAQTLLVSPR